MSKKLIFIILLAALLPFAAAAKGIGPNVSKYRDQELKWEDGAFGYHVMFKSLIENKEKDPDPNNPQGDTCKDASTYTLDMTHVPADAIIEDAYLVWTAAQPIAKKDDITDKEVTLSFISSQNAALNNTQTISGKKAYKVSEAGSVEFEFDGFKDTENPNKSWYTYRVKVLDFFKTIQDNGRAAATEGSAFYDGYSLLGNYTLSGLECANDKEYKDYTEMVADWSIILIYSSATISPKKIYIYDGFRSYWHEYGEINVTGFVFPLNPEIRITLASHEGDPGLADVPNGKPLVREGIEIFGEPIMPTEEWLLLSNICNPKAEFNKNGVFLQYTEIFNSISSVYDYSGETLSCIGGQPPVYNNEEIEYGIEVDTFLIDSTPDPSNVESDAYANHFHKGGQTISFRIGANQDQAITNYMIVSVDTKAPVFDIPAQPEKVACTPANDFKPVSMDGSWCQGSLEHTFALRIQNWGTDSTKEIVVKDSIPAGMEYVPGSTEYATSFKVEDGKKIATRWIPIPDTNGFPLENGFKVAESLNFCPEGSTYLDCDDLVMVRFRAKVKNDTPKNQIIENIATYKTAGVLNDYRTNLGIPVKLRIKSAGCATAQDAVDLSECGGVAAAACTSNEECGEGNICNKETGACETDPSIVQCQDAQIKVNLGKNSPNGYVLIANPQENLVIAQIELEGSGEKCYLNLDQIKVKLNINDNKINLSNLKMYKEEADKANGIVDGSDILIASGDIASSEATFSASKPENLIWNNKKNNVLIVLDASYAGESIGNNSFFQPVIENGGVIISGKGKPQIDGLPMELAKFQFEPKEGLIITKGQHDPAVPSKSEMNSFRDVMQLRVLAKGSDDKIKKITIATEPKSVGFGHGINKIAVYEDTDNDGKGDKELAAETSFSDQRKVKLTINFDVAKDTEKYLTIKAEPSLSEGELFQIKVSEATTENLTPYGIPVQSKPYEYTCNPDVEECGDDGGCSITALDF